MGRSLGQLPGKEEGRVELEVRERKNITLPLGVSETSTFPEFFCVAQEMLEPMRV